MPSSYFPAVTGAKRLVSTLSKLGFRNYRAGHHTYWPIFSRWLLQLK